MAMRIKLWGVRGSLPSPMSPSELKDRNKQLIEAFLDSKYRQKSEIDAFLSTLPHHVVSTFGGNTPCVEVRTPGSQAIIDAGSGIRRLGYEMLKGPCGRGAGEAHIFFTHFHWDHLIGMPFFVPIFIPGNTIHVYAVQPELPDVFSTLFKKPYFPVALENLGAKIVYHRLEPRTPFVLNDLTVTPYRLDHPDPCWGFRFEHEKKVFAHCVDTECKRSSRERLGEDLPLYQGVDLMTFDGQYTLMETIEKVDWGHASACLGVDIAIREGVKKVIFMHHDPASSDEKIASAEAQARRYHKGQIKYAGEDAAQAKSLEWFFATEEMTIEV